MRKLGLDHALAYGILALHLDTWDIRLAVKKPPKGVDKDAAGEALIGDKKATIWLDIPYLSKRGQNIERTLFHELAHIAFAHSGGWKLNERTCKAEEAFAWTVADLLCRNYLHYLTAMIGRK